jgi:hypothetical protein
MKPNEWPKQYPIDESAGYTCVYRKQEFHFDTREEALEFLHAHHGTVMISKYKKKED